MKNILVYFYRWYASKWYPHLDIEGIIEKLNREYPEEGEMFCKFDDFPGRVTKCIMNDKFETIMLFRFKQDSLCIARRVGERDKIKLLVFENRGDWVETLNYPPFWIFAGDFPEMANYFDHITLHTKLVNYN